jgi:hypothetical protein
MVIRINFVLSQRVSFLEYLLDVHRVAQFSLGMSQALAEPPTSFDSWGSIPRF